jgi:uncharacterized protein
VFRTLLICAFILSGSLANAGEPIFDAAISGDTTKIDILISSGTSVDTRAPDKATPLIAAALGGHFEAAKLLVGKGADVMARNSGGFTALHAAAYFGSVPIADLLLENGAVRDDANNKAGVAPLFVAVEMNHPEVVEFLIARGSDVRRPESHGYSPVTRAFWKGHKDMVRLLKRYGLVCQSPPLRSDDYQECLDIQ